MGKKGKGKKTDDGEQQQPSPTAAAAVATPPMPQQLQPSTSVEPQSPEQEQKPKGKRQQEVVEGSSQQPPSPSSTPVQQEVGEVTPKLEKVQLEEKGEQKSKKQKQRQQVTTPSPQESLTSIQQQEQERQPQKQRKPQQQQRQLPPQQPQQQLQQQQPQQQQQRQWAQQQPPPQQQRKPQQQQQQQPHQQQLQQPPPQQQRKPQQQQQQQPHQQQLQQPPPQQQRKPQQQQPHQQQLQQPPPQQQRKPQQQQQQPHQQQLQQPPPQQQRQWPQQQQPQQQQRQGAQQQPQQQQWRQPQQQQPPRKQIQPQTLPSSTQQAQPPTGRPQQQQRPSPPAAIQQPSPEQSPKGPQIKLPELRKDHNRTRGYSGRPIPIETNHLALSIKPKYETAVHYDVTITPDKPKRMMRAVWTEFMLKYLPRSQAAFDNVKNAYAPSSLFNGDSLSGTVEIVEEDRLRPSSYTVVLKYANLINLLELNNYLKNSNTMELPAEALQCIDVVLNNVSSMRFVRVARSFFSPPTGRVMSLGDGLELWHGHFQSSVLGWKPFFNIDVAHKGFPISQNVAQLMCEICGVNDPAFVRGDDFKMRAVETFLKGLKIRYEVPNKPEDRRSYRVNALVETPDRAEFEIDKKRTNVLNYFRNTKKYNIRYPNLPLLFVGPRDKPTKIYYPPELCTIVSGQVINKKLNEIQTSNMVRNAATSTKVRKDKIMNSLRQVNFNSDPCMKAFGLNVATDFEKLKARVLEPPNIFYSDRNIEKPAQGKWRAKGFEQPRNLSKWTILNMDNRTRPDVIENFVRMFISSARQLSMNVANAIEPYESIETRGPYEEVLKKYFSKLGTMELIVVIVPNYPSDCYSKVKRAAEIFVGCLTQCIKGVTMMKMDRSTVGNILLKVNAKLNGRNHKLAPMGKPIFLQREICMLVGADVTHPSPDQTEIPSVAAVTASYDPTGAFKYHFCWRLQPPRQEIITDLKNIMREQLLFFYSNTDKRKPQRIIFFRDGVSEGQFNLVLNGEVTAIREACASLGDGSYKPKISFLVVQKRHHTRFFPLNPRDSEDRNENVPAGTLVDTEIVHPTAVEYYLVSHASIQGVARPTKYRMLWDDADMTDDEIQQLTYYLCFLFSRCTRSVSYPAPTYYAHLAAFRGRVYLEGKRVDMNNLNREQQNLTNEKLFKTNPMFFV